ncbi:MAG: DUF1588 domain-containing protein, partial [Myxococcales bacterium]|nr:DUF1588 domain-containing protein [Myxococcales bacterium]
LWNTVPRRRLPGRRRSPEACARPMQIEAQARRMLEDDRAKAVVLMFHEKLLGLQKYDRIAPSSTAFPEVSPRLAQHARKEAERFIEMMFDEGLGVRELFASPMTHVNRELAQLYRLEGDFPADELVRADLSSTGRRGLFMHIGFLATYATAWDPDPIHRGIFLSERMACNRIGVPPGAIPPLPPAEGRTNREVVANHTEQPGTDCISCHKSLINPFGFAFEGFDAAGRVRTEDRGQPVDTLAEPAIGAATLVVRDALDLVTTMSTHPAVHRCYAKHWLEFTFGQVAERAPDGLLDRLTQRSLEGASVQDLILEIVRSRPFRTRSTETDP